MSAARRHKKHHHEEHENHERWLVSGYDMMTLLFAVFVVLYAISSTNVSKVKALQQSLQDAFSGPVLTGGQAMMQTGDTSDGENSVAEPPLPSLSPVQAVNEAMSPQSAEQEAKAAGREEEAFQSLKRRIDELVEEAGLGDNVSTTVSHRGLKVRLMTDELFFDSGSAVVNAAALPTLDKIGVIIAQERTHPIAVEGHTDDRPIATSQFPSNWQLSGARAGAVVQRLERAGVSGRRMSLAGYGPQHPVATNASAAGRAHNRRVEIVLTRLHGANSSHGGDS
ncbi:MAG TPA: flagellar motor protein MotB [Solirubrobacteraceae bacterium]|nr:flagellar motor protein MotB [Solirubrobacteraceae bacterium]